MTNDELTEALGALRDELRMLRVKHYIQQAKLAAIEAFLVRTHGAKARSDISALMKQAYAKLIDDLQARNPGLAGRMDVRQALPEDAQPDWYLPEGPQPPDNNPQPLG